MAGNFVGQRQIQSSCTSNQVAIAPREPEGPQTNPPLQPSVRITLNMQHSGYDGRGGAVIESQEWFCMCVGGGCFF